MAAGQLLTVTPPIALTLTAGGSVAARIGVAIADGYHIQANPASGEFLIPVQLDLEPAGAVRPGEPAYPPGQPYRLEGTPDDIMVYAGSVEIVVPLLADVSAQAGDAVLRGTIRYQACDARSCLAPTSIAVELAVRIVADPASP